MTWLTSGICFNEVFVGTRVAESQTVTERKSWRSVDSKNNSADYITRVQKPLRASSATQMESRPSIPLALNTNCWPANPCVPAESEPNEKIHVLRRSDVKYNLNITQKLRETSYHAKEEIRVLP